MKGGWNPRSARRRREPPPQAIEALNAILLETLPHQCLARAPSGWRWVFAPEREDDFRRPLWAVILSATDVLTSKHHARVGRCAAEDCDLLFIGSNAGSRRKWCSMETCGQPIKARRPLAELQAA